jgi:hypothetical protein
MVHQSEWMASGHCTEFYDMYTIFKLSLQDFLQMVSVENIPLWLRSAHEPMDTEKTKMTKKLEVGTPVFHRSTANEEEWL